MTRENNYTFSNVKSFFPSKCTHQYDVCHQLRHMMTYVSLQDDATTLSDAWRDPAADRAAARGLRRFRQINFAGRIYSGNGKLLQGDIYRGGADGRAAWREIKSDCLGKSEPSTRAIGTAVAFPPPPSPCPPGTPTTHLRSAKSPCCIPAAKRRNTKNIRIETLTDPRRRRRRRSRLQRPPLWLYARRPFRPIRRPYDDDGRNGTTLPRARSLTPESISRTAIKHRDVSSTLCATARG